MKKLILSAAAIAVTFGFFAFTPAEQNNVVNNAVTTDANFVGGSCDTKYMTDVTFSKCNKTWTDPIGYTFEKDVLDQL